MAKGNDKKTQVEVDKTDRVKVENLYTSDIMLPCKTLVKKGQTIECDIDIKHKVVNQWLDKKVIKVS